MTWIGTFFAQDINDNADSLIQLADSYLLDKQKNNNSWFYRHSIWHQLCRTWRSSRQAGVHTVVAVGMGSAKQQFGSSVKKIKIYKISFTFTVVYL